MAKTPKSPLKPDTVLLTAGRDTKGQHGFVNPAVYHASTVLYPTAEDQVAHRSRYQYGRRGTPTSEALEQALAALEGDGGTGGDIAKLFKPNTRAVFVEAPGSQSFEMQDIPAIAKIAHDKGAVVLMDNTWATPLYYRAFEKGVDLSIQAGTKYIGGHSDIMFGCVSANAKTLPALKTVVQTMGLCVGPDDMYLALRGLRTLGVRLARHNESGLRVARWLAQRPEVLRVLHPALESDPGYKIWQRDFSGACGLFSNVLKPAAEKAVHAFMSALALFGMGFSWCGFDSLVILFDCSEYRTATKWAPGGPTLRFHIGLQNPDDLLAALECGFAALAAAE